MHRAERQRVKLQSKKRLLGNRQVKRDIEFETWLRGVQRSGMYPLDTPGMPVAGPNFVRHACELGDNDTSVYQVSVEDATKKTGKRNEQRVKAGAILNELYLRALREPGFVLPIATRGGKTAPVTFVPGHIWSQANATNDMGERTGKVNGPHPAKVMVIGKMPWKEETDEGRNLIGPTGELLIDILQQMHVKDTGMWYVTNLLKFMPADGSSNIKAGELRDCLPLLHQELRIVQPTYILCLGADASKALLGPKATVTQMDGRVVDYTYSTGVTSEEPRTRTAQVMTVIHPASVIRDESSRRQLERGLARFNLLQQGIRFDKEEKDIDHRTVDNLSDLEFLLQEIEHDPQKKDSILAVDAEWHGEHPVNKGAYMRTIQFAWRPKHAAAVKINKAGGGTAFVDDEGKPALRRGMKLLTAFFKGGKYNGKTYRKKRVVGHFFVADLEWLVHNGLDIRDEFAVPLYDLNLQDKSVPKALRRIYTKKGYKRTVPAWVRTRFEGGACTGMMAHAIEESASFKLETLAMRYTTVPRYDIPLHDWREAYCKANDLKSKDLEGYGECPDNILIPYGIYDADATLRLYYALVEYLDCDYEKNCCREAFWESMIATPAILEVHQNGIMVDRKRIDYLTEKFMTARSRQEKKIKKWSKWPDFNIRSVQHVKEFLFGEHLNGKITKDGQIIRIRPDAAKSLYLQPLIDTGKPPKQWADLMQRGEEMDHSPSTNKQVLSILAQENDELSTQINWIRDYRFLDQVLKSVLRPPRVDDDGNWVYEDTSDGGSLDGGIGDLAYDAGLASVICSDNRVRTHLYPTAETGRWKSARPNLQNMSKQRDPDYTRLLGGIKNEKGKWVGGDYKWPLRSILRSSPGTLLVEADYIGAELYGMAIMSGDACMIDHAQRNQLPESDPRFYDIHSNVAVMAFGLGCKPTKKGLDDIGKAHLRIIAKNVIFGIAYGRGAKAIAFAAKEQGIRISVNDAQQVINTIFAMYPGLVPFFEEAENRALQQRWLCHCFGRFRRFPMASDEKLGGEFARQAMNFPIQGMIASAVDRAIAYLYDYKKTCGNPNLFKILLQVHDALLLEVPYANVEFVAQEVLPWAMRKMVPIYPTTLAGVPTGRGPYNLGIDVEVCEHWGQKLSVEQAMTYGIPHKSWTGDGVAVKYAA